jgi:hypothetical protein
MNALLATPIYTHEKVVLFVHHVCMINNWLPWLAIPLNAQTRVLSYTTQREQVYLTEYICCVYLCEGIHLAWAFDHKYVIHFMVHG